MVVVDNGQELLHFSTIIALSLVPCPGVAETVSGRSGVGRHILCEAIKPIHVRGVTV